MQIEYTAPPIETIWQHVDGFVTFKQRLENMNNNSWRHTWTIMLHGRPKLLTSI